MFISVFQHDSQSFTSFLKAIYGQATANWALQKAEITTEEKTSLLAFSFISRLENTIKIPDHYYWLMMPCLFNSIFSPKIKKK